MEIVRRLGASQERVAGHLTRLTWCRFVAASTEGRKSLYRVAGARSLMIPLAHRFLSSNVTVITSSRTMDL
jgi:predicted transcriptional regulator